MSNAFYLVQVPWRGALRLARCVLLLLAAMSFPFAYAAPVCIPAAGGVPALSGPPNWLDSAPGFPGYWPKDDDPRWRGATSRSLGGSGASEHVQFRALRDAGALYLSWHVKVAPSMSSSEALNIGVSPGGAAQDQLIVIYPNNVAGALASEENVVPPQMATNVSHVRSGPGGSWGPPQAMPAWVATNTRVSRNLASATWSVRMRLPVAAGYDTGINLDPSFRIWYEVDVNTADGLVPYINLSNAANNLEWVFLQTNASGWEEFNRTLTSSDPAVCARDVSLASSDIGSKYMDGATPRPNRIRIDGSNTFFAHPKNETGNTIPANAICAQFRVANWGSQPDWNDVADPSTLWKLVSAECPVGPKNPGQILANAKANTAANEITQAWAMTAAERCELTGSTGVPANQTDDGVAIPAPPPGTCPAGPPTRRLHQCMLVELSGGGLTYSPAGVYRNMDFVKASAFTRDAEVSVKGLAPGGPAQRDVYLYVKTYQLPARIDQPQPADGLLDFAAARKFWRRRGDDSRPPTSISEGAEPPKLPPLGEPHDLLNQIYPTYIVHAYHDTGRTVTRKGTVHKVLRPQSSFGYYVNHEGALTGWDHSLEGAQQIAPDFYKLSLGPNETAKVTTRIVAREGDEGSRFAMWGGLGIAIPHGSFSNTHRRGPAGALGFEYAMTRDLSAEVTLAFHRLDGKAANDDADVTQVGVNAKWYFLPAPLRAFATAGVGLYGFDPGSTRFGLNAGLGLQWQFTPQWSLEGRYTLHRVFNNSPRSSFSSLLVGVRYSF